MTGGLFLFADQGHGPTAVDAGGAVSAALAVASVTPTGGASGLVPDVIAGKLDKTGDASDATVLPTYGSVARPLVQVLGPAMYSDAFMPDSGSDDTARLQAMIARITAEGGGHWRLSKKVNQISATLDFGSAIGVTLEGPNCQTGSITSTAATAPVIRDAGINNLLEGLLIAHAGTPGPGGIGILYANAQSPTARSILTFNNDTSIFIQGVPGYGTALKLSDFSLAQHTTCGIAADKAVDIYIANGVINAGSQANAINGNVRLTNGVEALVMVNVDVLLGRFPLTTAADQFLPGVRPEYCFFANIYWDSSQQGSVLDKICLSSFTNNWWSGGHDVIAGNYYNALTLLQTDSLTFNANIWFNAGRHGLGATNQTRRLRVLGGSAESNSATAPPGSPSAPAGTGNGVNIGAGTTDFIIMGLAGSNDLYHSSVTGGYQGWAILVEGGASDRYSIRDNLVQGNLYGGVYDGGTGTNKHVGENW